MLALRHPRGVAAAERWHKRFLAERNPRRVEDEIVGAALTGVGIGAAVLIALASAA